MKSFFPLFSLAFPLSVPSGLLSAEATDIREILRELLQQADIFLISTNTMGKSRKLLLFIKFSKLTGFSFRFLLAGEVVNHVTNLRVPQCKTLSGCVSNGEDIFLSLLTDHMKSPNYPLKPLSSLSL